MMPSREITNAIIRDAKIECEDHGFITVWLSLDFGGTQQGFGGFALAKQDKKDRVWTGHMAMWITRIMEIAEVSEWSRLKGKTIRADRDWNGIYRIGHIVKDEWFDPKEEGEL